MLAKSKLNSIENLVSQSLGNKSRRIYDDFEEER